MSFLTPRQDKCTVCTKTVYETEKMSIEGILFHKSCFRCKECQCVMKLGNYAAMKGEFYCKVHFKQLFKLRGNYDEGFGKKKHSTLWLEGGERTPDGKRRNTSDGSEDDVPVENKSTPPSSNTDRDIDTPSDSPASSPAVPARNATTTTTTTPTTGSPAIPRAQTSPAVVQSSAPAPTTATPTPTATPAATPAATPTTDQQQPYYATTARVAPPPMPKPAAPLW